MSVIFLFIDGVGLGKEEESNPLATQPLKGLNGMAKGQHITAAAAPVKKRDHLFKPVDARLGVVGLPQSGTGQTTLFSGENAAKTLGRHFGPYPHTKIKPILRERSLFRKAQERGKKCYFMNAYPDIFFKKARRKNRWSCTTLMTRSAGLPLNTAKEVREEKAITAEIIQRAWREMLGIDIPEITPARAAERVIAMAREKDLVLAEYYLTDKAGHKQDARMAAEVLSVYDRFLASLMEMKEKDQTIVLCSDHGNVEDLSRKTHTLNNVPLFAMGPGARHFHDAESILDVTGAILETLRD